MNFVFVVNGVEYSLEPRQKRFCDEYLTNGYIAYRAIIDAGYDVWNKDKEGHSKGTVNYSMARSMGSINLTKVNICAYINSQLDANGFNEANVKAQHAFVLNQSNDLAAKNKAIDMFYKLNGMYAAERVEHGFEAEAAAALQALAAALPK